MTASLWGFGVPDDIVQKSYPAYCLLPQENGGKYVEIREIVGDLWIVINATFNSNAQQWYQPNPPCDFTQNATATVYRATGAQQHYNASATGAATTPINWGTPFWAVDPSGSSSVIGATRAALVGNVPADGTAPTPVQFLTPFTNTAQGVALGIMNPFQSNNWQLSAQWDSLTTAGFNLNVTGAPAGIGAVVSVFYIAGGT